MHATLDELMQGEPLVLAEPAPEEDADGVEKRKGVEAALDADEARMVQAVQHEMMGL